MEWLGTQTPPLGTPINENHPLRKGLVGHWKLDEQTLIDGSRVEDISLFKNHGTLSTGDGAVNKSTYGKLNRACSFDGVNDYVGTISQPYNYIYVNQLKPQTTSLWIKPNTLSGGIQPIIGATTAQVPYYNTYSQGLFLEDSNIFVSWSNNSNAVYLATLTDFTPYLGEWVCITFSTSSSYVLLYINGNLIKNYIGSTNRYTYTFCIGANISGSKGYFNGLIDNIRIFNRALSAWEIDHYLYRNPFAYHIKNRYWSLVVGTRYDEIFNDGLAITDSHIKSISKTLADSISLSDTVVKQVDVAKDDGFTISDSLVKDIAIGLSDTIVFSDNIKRDLSVAFDDSVTFTDEIIGGIEILLNFADGIVFTDSFQKSVAIVKDDTINLSDDTSKVISVNLSDIIRLADARVTQISKVLSDDINIDESQSQIKMKLVDMPHAVINVTVPRYKGIHLIVRNP